MPVRLLCCRRFSPSVSGGAAVAARVERAFKQPVRVADNRARVAHGFAKVREDLHLVTQRLQACDRFKGKPAFHALRWSELCPEVRPSSQRGREMLLQRQALHHSG